MIKPNVSNRRTSSSVVLEPEVAIAVIGLLSAASDGEGITIEEEYALSEMLGGISQFENYSDEDYRNLTDKVYSLLESTEPENLLAQAIDSLPDQDYCEAAYITALLVVGIDEEVPDSEQDYISSLQEDLNISDKRAQQIINEIFGEEDETEYEDEE
ncbi:tellurite resistance TerB family protein [Tolypothrix sp. PCC 7910]|uniref:tellurite resistance TerB family protein n=1 Tax=Tolypothrix sp. PCC 7910 TaxID=2099387 RepID=UPI00142779B4|nr:tellurite resistance TerB family protein [Tolypothrix sp. PCC 7910]QIR39544.1 tellurite resistance TerB family protein [Tolypothrix sp. PCC 7910]